MRTAAHRTRDHLPPFAARVVAWHARYGRHDLPWQNTRDPYRIWLSEVMLQQTQVSAVIPYYERFVAALPDVAALAGAPLDTVFALWSGLGYYRRARHLHAAANAIIQKHGGVFPRDVGEIAALPGIGRSTAAAIAAFAYGTRAAILDGNVKRVFARHRGIEGYPGEAKIEQRLWSIAESELPDANMPAYTQAMMDLGATVCVRTRPRCDACPVAEDCTARRERCVDRIPAPRPLRALPERSARMLMIEAGDLLLFERRAESGVWAGLWSLPEVGIDDDVSVACVSRVGAAPLSCAALPPIEHGFTHFRLTIHPVRIGVAAAPAALASSDRAWWTVEHALRQGVPAPVRRLLEALRSKEAELF